MKKSKVNITLIAVFVLIALFNQCREAHIKKESKIADEIKFNAVEVNLEDILTPPQYDIIENFDEYYTEDACKIR